MPVGPVEVRPVFTSRGRVLAAIAVVLLAAGVRFARLGDWSFAADEAASVQEADVLLDGRPVSDDPITRLPRMTPVGAAIHGLSYRTLGRSEFAARLPAAVAGVLLCGLAVVGLWPALGGWTATATGLLLALSPEFVFYSQYNRYYALGALLAAGSVLAALAAVRTRSVRWMATACGMALVGVFVHLLLAGLFAGLLVVALSAPAATWRERGKLAAVVIAFGVIATAIGVLYLAPLARGWNAGVDWGYSIPRALAGGVNQLGVPTALLAGLGVVLALAHPLRWFWAVWAGGWLASLVVLPKLLAFHPAYSFLFLFGPVVLAGYAVGVIAEKLATSRGMLPAAAWVGVAVLLNAPSLASHFADGSRHDFRAGAQFVAEYRRPGEAVAAVSPGNFAFYAPELADAERLNPDRLTDGFRQVAAANRPCWVVLIGGRTPRDADAQRWLNENCRLKATFRKPRFDYYDFTIDVYYFDPR
ncbi:MAG TPA: glycosyltransferase family 39 protein [Gemmataceae bacterium]|nr:glycosyltransferase family 39 protein [Gemmataceae bacterium]